MLDAVKKAGEESERLGAYARRFEQSLKDEGFYSQTGGQSDAPYDLLGDFFRGTKGLMLDMFRRPETVLKACDMLLPLEIEKGIQSTRRVGGKMCFIALHKGLDGFMSGNNSRNFTGRHCAN